MGSGGWLWGLPQLLCLITLGPDLLPPCLSSLFQADVRNAEALHRTFEGVDCVFHVASYGMSGAEQVRPPHTHTGLRFRLCLPPPNAWEFIMHFTYSKEDLGYTQPTFGP